MIRTPALARSTQRLCQRCMYSSCRPALHHAALSGRRQGQAQARFFTSPPTSQSADRLARRFTYSVAASYNAKHRAFDSSTHVFHFNPYNRVQPPKHRGKGSRPDSGQDAFFISRLDDKGGVALGVADGVGGWMDQGVDPADFSHGICDYMAAAANEYYQDPKPAPPSADGSAIDRRAPPGPLTARHLMQIGYDAICGDPTVPAGGSTAVVCLLDPRGRLEIANLGDSGFIHLRPNAIRRCSEPQLHAFNTPYQLSVVPQEQLRQMQTYGGTQLADLPRDAEVTRDEALCHGDVLVFATDGLWDNLFNQDILRIVSGVMRTSGAWGPNPVNDGGYSGGIRVAQDLAPLTSLPEPTAESMITLQGTIATEIAYAAKMASTDAKLFSPFAKEVKRWHPQEHYLGGKEDDICVVAVVVEEATDKVLPHIGSKL